MSNQNVFLISWDMLGLEAIIDVGALEKENTWNLLQDKPQNNLGQIVTAIMMRARYNSQRHYEVYTITTTEGITEQDLRTMFEESPQQAAELIRERGNKVYSDRIEPNKVRIS